MLKRSELIAKLKTIIKTDSTRFEAGAFDSAVEDGLNLMTKTYPITCNGVITLKAGIACYDLPVDCFDYINSDWGITRINPWDANFPGTKPRVFLQDDSPNKKQLRFTPPPFLIHLSAYGSTFNYYYSRRHEITEETNSLGDDKTPLLITACMIALMQQLMSSAVTRPITLSRGVGSSIPSNSSPSSIYKLLKQSFKDDAPQPYL